MAGLDRLLGLTHLVHAAANHALNGIIAVQQRIFQRLDYLHDVAVGLDPQSNAPVCLFQIFEHQFSSARTVKGEDQSTEGPEQLAQPARGF